MEKVFKLLLIEVLMKRNVEQPVVSDQASYQLKYDRKIFTETVKQCSEMLEDASDELKLTKKSFTEALKK